MDGDIVLLRVHAEENLLLEFQEFGPRLLVSRQTRERLLLTFEKRRLWVGRQGPSRQAR